MPSAECNPYKYLHLHALAMTEYAAVVVLEEGMSPRYGSLGDHRPLVARAQFYADVGIFFARGPMVDWRTVYYCRSVRATLSPSLGLLPVFKRC
jgi:hypothetical protein